MRGRARVLRARWNESGKAQRQRRNEQSFHKDLLFGRSISKTGRRRVGDKELEAAPTCSWAGHSGDAPVTAAAVFRSGVKPTNKETSSDRSFRGVIPNVGWELFLERCVHGVTEQFHRWKWRKCNSELHDQSMLVAHPDLAPH